MNHIELLKLAKEGMKKSYSPYSKFKVGAALLTDSGNVYVGCNVENSSYGATICAEQSAISKAISEGERGFVKIAVVSSSDQYTFPCGICRQILSEFMWNGIVILEDKVKGIAEYNVSDLLPEAFILESLQKEESNE